MSAVRRSRAAGTGIAIGITLMLAGCSAAEPETTSQLSDATFSHIHELVPEGDQLLVATHEGLYRVTIDGADAGRTTGPVGDHVFDPMGFVAAAGDAYASGHPGPDSPASFGTPNLGLVRSGDGGATWSNVSLTGETDFHALTARSVDGTTQIFGLPADGAVLQISDDEGATWRDGAPLVARDLQATERFLYATTADGLRVSRDGGASFAIDSSAPVLYLIAAADDESLIGVDIEGTIWVQETTGEWIRGGQALDTPVALAFDGSRVFVADSSGIAVSSDLGTTWSTPGAATEN